MQSVCISLIAGIFRLIFQWFSVWIVDKVLPSLQRTAACILYTISLHYPIFIFTHPTQHYTLFAHYLYVHYLYTTNKLSSTKQYLHTIYIHYKLPTQVHTITYLLTIYTYTLSRYLLTIYTLSMQWAAAVLLPARHPQPLGGQHQHDQRLLRGARAGGQGGVQIPGPQAHARYSSRVLGG